MAIRDFIIGRAIRDTLLYFIAAFVLVADQVSKLLVQIYIPLGETFPQGDPPRLTHTTNTGAAFSLLPDQTVLFIIIAVVVIAVILSYERFMPLSGRWVKVSLGLQLGGAFGNLLDRLRFGKVTDFVEVGFWPIFNLADSAICVGVGILVFILLFSSEVKREVEHLPPTG